MIKSYTTMRKMNVFRLCRMMKPLMVIAVLTATLASCSEDDDPKVAGPAISGFEFGQGGTHSTDGIAYKGSDIHIEAGIVAEATVKSITLEIHAHGLEDAWEFEKIYTDAKYLVKNPTFHEHVDVPTNIPAGEYHLTLVVTDQNNNTSEVEGHLEILDPISVSDISIDETVARGDDFHTEFMISAVHGIRHIIVNIHGHGITVGDGEVEWHFEEEFEEGYHDEAEVKFHEHIDVPATAPAGEYHMTITIEDEKGNTIEFEKHIEVTEL